MKKKSIKKEFAAVNFLTDVVLFMNKIASQISENKATKKEVLELLRDGLKQVIEFDEKQK